MNHNHFLMIFSGLVFYWVVTIYQPFLLDMAIAALLAIATANLHAYFFEKTRNDLAAASLITLVMALILFGPIVYFIVTISSAVSGVDPKLVQNVIQKVLKLLEEAPESLRFIEPMIKDFIQGIQITALSQDVLGIFGNIGAKSAIFIKDTILIVIFFFFAHFYGKKLLVYLKENVPMDEENAVFLFNETSLVMSVTSYSIIITAIFEGALFALAAYFLGYDAILFGILYGFASLIPVVGGMIMWLPIALFELYQGNIGQAIFISVYTVVVISIIADTFIKPLIIGFVNQRLIGKPSKINSVIIFFAIVAGLSTHGFWGMILGPAVTALFVAIISVYGSLRHRNIEEPSPNNL